ncbi:hypothetical protein FGO68_gene16850 [Halteria grandinella]|uniref:Uncharacterized protein n=1 Tax=Halteria grandinella TaxID=5974 RepID=A0A8J8T422_HALGN|nr:hypothetical protein FGO68_gene16850 [Halteria grandinella]
MYPPLNNTQSFSINNYSADIQLEIVIKECVLDSNNPTDSPTQVEKQSPECPINKEDLIFDISLEGLHLQDCRSPSFIQDLSDTANADASFIPNTENAFSFNSPNPLIHNFQALNVSPLNSDSEAQSLGYYLDHQYLDSSYSENHSSVPGFPDLNEQNAYNQQFRHIPDQNCPIGSYSEWQRPTPTSRPSTQNQRQQMINDHVAIREEYKAANNTNQEI